MSFMIKQQIESASRRRSVGIDVDAAALIAAMTVTPDSTRQSLINTTIVDLKAAGIWDKLDDIWFLAAHDQQAARIGWKRKLVASVIGTPSFTVDRGAVGTNGGYNSLLNPTSFNGQYQLTNCSLGCYNRTATSANFGIIGARISGGNSEAVMFLKLFNDNPNIRLNVGATSNYGEFSTPITGFMVFRRTGTSVSGVRNGVQQAVNTSNAATARPNMNFHLCGHNNNGSYAGSPFQAAMVFVGAYFDDSELVDFNNIIQAYMVAVGANV